MINISPNFTPISGIIGGILLGLGAALLLLAQGRIAGISGILSGLYSTKLSEWFWRLSFLIGIPIGAFLFMQVELAPLNIQISNNKLLLISSGLLVGIGTVLGSGCTSGHGICGIARLSKRSIVSTLIYMGVAILVVYIIRHLL